MSVSVIPSQKTGFQNCPVLGVGLGLRRPLVQDILAYQNHSTEPLIHWLELTPENFIRRGGKSRQILESAKALYPLVPHGVSLSIGSTDPWNHEFLNDLKTLFDDINAPWVSDHLCFSSVDGKYFNDLMPLPQTPAVANYVAGRIRELQDFFQRPVLIENASQYIKYTSDTLSDADFFAMILEKADCGLLLDVNNVYVNATNHPAKSNAQQFLENLPLERVVQIHVAGHDDNGTCLIDTHGAPVCDPVWELLHWVLARCNPCGVMLERDTAIPPFEELLPELAMIETIWQASNQLAVVSR